MIKFILALFPILWLIMLLCVFKVKAHIASVTTGIVAFVEAILIWHMPVLHASTAALEGFAMALWPIVVVIIAAVFTYNLTVHTGAMETIKQMIVKVSSDKRILVILIGWCFGGFLEGMAGFGVAIAIPSSMLVALGFHPVEAILACLIANGCPTMFGSIGIPTTTLANVTGLEAGLLAFKQTIMTAPLLFISPFLMVTLVGGGKKALKGLVPFVLVGSLSFVIPEILTARFMGAELAVIIASVCSLICTIGYATKFSKTHQVPEEYVMDVGGNDEHIDMKKALKAWSPFILIFVLLILTSKVCPFISEPLSRVKSSILIYQGPGGAPYTFQWLNTPGVVIFIAGIIGGLIQKCQWNGFVEVMKFTLNQMSKTIVTMLGVLACAKIMGYSGMIQDIANFLVVVLGTFYPLAAPLIGALGTFVTGSGTSSEVLFGNVQLQAAHAIQVDPYWLVASNSLGTSAGKMLAPQSIAIGTAACDAQGKDGEILGRIFKYALVYMILMSLIVFFGAHFLG